MGTLLPHSRLCQVKSYLRFVIPSRSPMLIDSPTNTEAARDPLPVLGLEMEVDNFFGLYNFKSENDNQNTSGSGPIFLCDKCGYTAPGEQDLNSHNEIMHGSPSCGTCTPLCWGSCGREVQIAQTTTSQSLNNGQGNTENSGPRGPQTDMNEKPPSVDCRILKYRGNLKEWWTCSVCGLSDKSIRIVADHVMSFHVLTNTHKCNRCNTSFGNEQRLQKHISLAHEDSAPAATPDNCDSMESTMC